ncbi:MAG: hypothetical protein R3F60_24560 [bacterium]
MEAARSLRTALFEPDNEHFRTALGQIERHLQGPMTLRPAEKQV